MQTVFDRKMEPTPRQAQPGLQASLPTVCAMDSGSGEDVSGDPGEGVGEYAGGGGREGVYNDSINRIVTVVPGCPPNVSDDDAFGVNRGLESEKHLGGSGSDTILHDNA